MNVTFLRDTRVKSDSFTIFAGTKATAEFVSYIPTGSNCERTALDVTLTNGRTFRTFKMSLFFKAPTVRTMEKWSSDGVAKTVTGKRCEPDGYGPDGSPSWLLALGLI